MKKSGEFRKDRLQTKKEWQEYAEELESLLLLRPVPMEDSRMDIDEWAQKYKDWYFQVVNAW